MGRLAVALGVSALWGVGGVRAPAMGAEANATRDAAKGEFFEKKVRPLLVAQCQTCHGAEKQKGGLRLDSRASLLEGGDSGPVLVPGHPEESPLIEAIGYGDILRMPPKGKLPPDQIATLTEWVEQGAFWPESEGFTPPKSEAGGPLFSGEQRAFWAFQPVSEPLPPSVDRADWPRSPLDHFILAKLEERGLGPSPQADRRTLIRRASFDLIGLPPTPEEVEEFLADPSPDAFARVVDRLLASPRYGERWGRHWLDVARYADSNGMDENLAFANAYRYRDYVVASFNRDTPYDQFVREQVAGDLLPASGAEALDLERIIATGFLSLGPKMLAEDDPVKMEMDIVDEQVDTVGRTFLGLTLGCARCHDHKFDPILTADYYSLAAIFKSTKTMANFKVVAFWNERSLASKAEQARAEAHGREVSRAKVAIVRRVKEAVAELFAACRRISARDLLARCSDALRPGRVDRRRPSALESASLFATLDALERERQELAKLESSAPMLPSAMAVEERTPQDLRIHIRGNHLTLGPEVPRRFPRILAGEDQTPLDRSQSGRRQLADWLARGDNPLTSRVMANRIWRWHFGAGLVRSTDNFGRLGDRPSHPELLDWLARRFVESGWSIKAMHRAIMLSATYQMSTAFDPKAALADPENRLYWRRDRHRLEAEAIRDALFAVGGGLDLTMGGSMLKTKNHAYVASTASLDTTDYNTNRRSIYLPVVRSSLYDVFQAFDFADPSVANGMRETTTVAPQALFMMNGAIMTKQSKGLARMLLDRAGLDDAGRVSLAYQKAYGRPPTGGEVERALAFVRRYEVALGARSSAPDDRRLRAWEGLSRVILAANEFIYIE